MSQPLASADVSQRANAAEQQDHYEQKVEHCGLQNRKGAPDASGMLGARLSRVRASPAHESTFVGDLRSEKRDDAAQKYARNTAQLAILRGCTGRFRLNVQIARCARSDGKFSFEELALVSRTRGVLSGATALHNWRGVERDRG